MGSAIRNPFYALITLLVVLFFPLDLIDYLIWIIISIIAVIINAILWILVGIANAIISVLNWIINTLVSAINSLPIINIGTPSSFDSFPYTKIIIEDLSINLFDSGTCLLTVILALLGIGLPLW